MNSYRASLAVTLLFLIFGTTLIFDQTLTDASTYDRSGGRAAYDLEYDDLIVPVDETWRFKNNTILVRGSLQVSGSLELINSTLCLSEDLAADHSVAGTLRALSIESGGNGTGSLIEMIGPTGSTRLDLSGGFFESNGSEIANLSIEGGDISAVWSVLRNSTLYRPRSLGPFWYNSFVDGTQRTAIVLNEANWELVHHSVSGYREGIRHEGAQLRLVSFSFRDCAQGVACLDTDSQGLRFQSVSSWNTSFSLQNWETVTIVDSTFDGGGLDLGSKPAYIHDSTFRGIDSVSSIHGGLVRGCLFSDCGTALDRPLGTSISLNRFISCSTAIADDRDCEIFHNTFLGNAELVSGFVQSLWYNATLSEGNHYDTYRGLDNGQGGRRRDDGIGDTDLPYMGRDYHPLLKDLYWLMPRIPDLSLEYAAGGPFIELDWDELSGEEYIVQCSASPDFRSVQSVYSASDGHLIVRALGNGTYQYRVASFDTYGSRGWSAPEAVDIDMRPLPPSGLTAVPVPEGGAMTLRWDWEGEDIFRGFLICSGPGEDEKVDLVYPPVDSHTVRGLKNGIRYRFTMVVMDGHEQTSDPSGPVEGMPIDSMPPPPPRDLSAEAINNSATTVQWNPPVPVSEGDLAGFLLYRRGPDDASFILIRSFNTGVLYYEDTGLADNTTYEYHMRSVDDDGPVSAPSETVRTTTLHYNSGPVFIGSSEVIYLSEDSPTSVIDVSSMFYDPEGDDLKVTVTDSFPFPSEMKGSLLYLYQMVNQSGNGYVQLLVTDGEAFEFFTLGIFIQPSPDPPAGLTILSPINGTVILPGSMTLLEGEAFDSDVIYENDILTYRWRSDKDGELSGPGISVTKMMVQLTPGMHEITLTVSDMDGTERSESINVVVSLWGWGAMPWSVSLDNATSPVTEDGGNLRLLLFNNGPLYLSFECTITLLAEGLNMTLERTAVSPPADMAFVLIIVPKGTGVGPLILRTEVSASTLNGTFAGNGTFAFSSEVVKAPEGGSDMTAYIVFGGIASTIVVLGGAYVILFLLGPGRGRGKMPYGAEDVSGGGHK